MNLFKKIFSGEQKPSCDKRDGKPLLLMNIESSYACNLSCRMCPRKNTYSGNGLLSDELMERILDEIHLAKFHHLSGFGEPLMHPKLSEIIRRISEKGGHPSFTTNATLLNEATSRKVIDAGVEDLNFSVDASSAEQYGKIRGGEFYETVKKNIRQFQDLARERGRQISVRWGFLMMKSTFHDLPEVVRIAAEEFDVYSIGAKHMETAVSRENLKEALFETQIVPSPEDALKKEFEEVLERARSNAKRYGVTLEIHPVRMIGAHNDCLTNPVERIMIDFEGNVSPCCYLNVRNMKPYIEDPPSDNGVLGNLKQSGLADILNSQRYKDFVECWAHNSHPESCEGCVQIARMGWKL